MVDAVLGADAQLPFFASGIAIDATAELSGYRLIVVPGVFLLRAGFAQRLVAAAQAGATVLIDSMSAWVDDEFACVAGGRPGPELRAALGLRCEMFDQLRSDERIALRGRDGWLDGATVQAHLDRVHAEGCEVLVSAADGFHDGWPVLTRRVVGSGSMWYLAGGLDADVLHALMTRIAGDAGDAPCLS